MTKKKKRVLALQQRTGWSGEKCVEVLRTRTPEEVERLARESEQERWANEPGYPVTDIEATTACPGFALQSLLGAS